LVTPLDAIKNKVLENNGEIQSASDNWASSQIKSLASQASVALVFVNADSGEGYINVDGNEGDRNNLTLWKNGETLITNVTALCNNTVVVIHSVGPVTMGSWANNPNVTGIIWAGLPGEQSGNSLVDVLYGAVNPAGKLPFTLGAARADYGTDLMYQPNNGEGAPQDDFTEGLFIDYRHFDKAGIQPVYEFGFGLSYTTFSYANVKVQSHSAKPYTPTTGQRPAAPVLGNYSTNLADYLFPSTLSHVPLYIYPYLNTTDAKTASNESDYGETADKFLPPGATDGGPQQNIPAGGAPGGNPALYDVLFTVTADIKNTGKVAGGEVVQLYISRGGPNDPVRELRNFDRLTLAPGESKTFSADITRRDISNWDPAQQNWVITNYTKTVYVGASSRKLYLNATLNMSGGGGYGHSSR
jgi:beta-glucosidase